MSDTKSCIILLHLPAHLVGRPVADIRRVLAQPVNRTLDVLAEQVHASINNPDISLDALLHTLHDARLTEALGEGLPDATQEPRT